MAKKEDVKIATLDAETDPFRRGRIPKPFLWGFYDGSSYEEFGKPEDPKLEEVAERLRAFDGIVYAHNGGKFDFHFLLPYMDRDTPIMLINGRLVKCKIGACELRDSFALLPAPLSAYKKDEISYSIFEKHLRWKPENYKKISHYLKGDCVYLYDMVTGFIRQYGMHLTQAGAAMKTWEEIAGNKAPQSTKRFFDEFSQFYYGGRVEVFRAGHIDGPLKLFDINSAYPWAMLNEHPYGLNYTERRNPDLEFINETSFIKVECVSLGALPYRDETGRITFPNDGAKRLYYAGGHEFLSALALNLIRDYTLIAAYNFGLKRDFSEYIKPFYQMRLDAKAKAKLIAEGKLDESLDYWKSQDLFAKLLMNSLYGKFGANPENYGHYLFGEPEAYKDTKYEEYARLGDVPVLRAPLNDREMRFYNVATAASITSQVRALLLRTIHASKGVTYCDTDSILCSEFGGDVGKELGQWKHEYDITEAWIAGKKMYAMKKAKRDKDGLYKTASKGVKLDAAEIKKMCAGETVLYRPQAPTFSAKKEPRFVNRSVKMLDEIAALK